MSEYSVENLVDLLKGWFNDRGVLDTSDAPRIAEFLDALYKELDNLPVSVEGLLVGN